MEKPIPARGCCGSKVKARYVLAILGSMGFGLVYGLKVGMHVAIVAMVNHTALQHGSETSKIRTESKCNFVESANVTTVALQDGPFLWGTEVQGLLLSSYFIGYILSQIPGGRIAELFSAKWVLFFAVAINVVGVLLSPVMSKLHYGGLLFMRILQGIGGGVSFPAGHVILAAWAPPLERGFMSSVTYAGTSLGTVIFILISGVIAGGLGWEAVFYIEGGIATIWLVLWALLIADSPDKQTFITQEERDYINGAIKTETGSAQAQTTHPPMPWKSVLTSPAFWAILVAHTCSNWGFYTVLIELPSYMKNVLQFQINQNAVLTSIPFFAMWLFSIVFSKVLDTLKGKAIITTTTARKIATLTASVVPLIGFLILCFVECQRVLAVVLLTIVTTSIGGMFCGFLSNHIDIAPNFAGTLMALTNTVATIPGIVVPIVVGKLTHADPGIASWRIVFYITIALYVIEIVVYTIFGSGEVQKWNRVAEPEEQPLKEEKTAL